MTTATNQVHGIALGDEVEFSSLYASKPMRKRLGAMATVTRVRSIIKTRRVEFEITFKSDERVWNWISANDMRTESQREFAMAQISALMQQGQR